jgi:hypothetical protein
MLFIIREFYIKFSYEPKNEEERRSSFAARNFHMTDIKNAQSFLPLFAGNEQPRSRRPLKLKSWRWISRPAHDFQILLWVIFTVPFRVDNGNHSGVRVYDNSLNVKAATAINDDVAFLKC